MCRALRRRGLHALGWVYSAAGERGGGGLRKLDGHGHHGEALEEPQGCPVIVLGENVQDGASRWDKVKLFPQELSRRSSGLQQEWASSVSIWGIPSASPWQNKSSWELHVCPRRSLKQKSLSPRTPFGGKSFALAVGNLKGFGLSGFVSEPHVATQQETVPSPWPYFFFNLEPMFLKAFSLFPQTKITYQQ